MSTLTGLLLTAALVGLVLGARAARGPRGRPYGTLRPGRDRRALAVAVPLAAAEMAASLRAGRSLAQALERAGALTPGPLGRELAVVVREVGLGRSIGAALGDLAARCRVPEIATLVAGVRVQHRSGGDLARTLDELGVRQRDALRLGGEVRAATAQARMTAWLVASLPVAAALLMELVAPGLSHRTLASPIGRGIVLASLGLQACGVLIVWRILRSVR